MLNIMDNTQKVTSFNPKEGMKASSHRKDKHFSKSYKVISYDPMEGFKEVVDLRFYETDKMCYACLWVHHKGIYANGSDSAGGYGYDKRSTAFELAANKAGIEFKNNFGGSGQNEEALTAIAEYLGLEAYTIVKANA